MQLNRKMTGALAWGGVALVLLIPSADFVSGQLGGQSLLVTRENTAGTPATAAIPVAPSPGAKPASEPQTQRVAMVDPVADYMKKGKALPSYITDGGAPAKAATPPAPAPASPGLAATPAPAVAPATATPKTTAPAAAGDVAVVREPEVAPVPMPAEMRPRPRPVTAAPKAAAVKPQTDSRPLIIDEGPVDLVTPPRTANGGDRLVEPPASFRTVPPEDVLLPPANVGKGGNAGPWEDEELAAYLEREGLVGRPGERRRRVDRFVDEEVLGDEQALDDEEDSSVIFLSR